MIVRDAADIQAAAPVRQVQGVAAAEPQNPDAVFGLLLRKGILRTRKIGRVKELHLKNIFVPLLDAKVVNTADSAKEKRPGLQLFAGPIPKSHCVRVFAPQPNKQKISV